MEIPTQEMTGSDDEILYILSGRAPGLILDEETDQGLIDLAESICDILDQGATAESIWEALDGFDYDEANSFMAATLVAYCPQHEDLFTE